MVWLNTDRNGFPYWEERATFNMYPHYGMLDLMDAKERRDNNCTFFMKVQDEKSAEYAGGVFLFRLADELVIYLLPISYKSGKKTLSKILCKWKQDSVISSFLYLDSVLKDDTVQNFV